MKKKRSMWRYNIGMVALLIVILSPIIWLFITSFKTNVQALQIPPQIFFKATFNNYPAVILNNPDFFKYYFNSILTSVLSTLIVLILGTPAAYILARFHFRGRTFMLFTILATRMIPQVAIGIPLYMIIMKIGQLDTYTSLILSFVSFNLPFAIWILIGFIESIPKEIEEAGMIDGCSRYSVFYRIILPLTVSGMAAVAILVLIVCWKEFFLPLILTSTPNAKTLSVVAGQFMTEYGVNWGEMSAFSILTFLPVLGLAGYAQKYLISGLTMGAVKG